MEDKIHQCLWEYWGGKASPDQEKYIAGWLDEDTKNKEYLGELYRLYCRINYTEKVNSIDLSFSEKKMLSQLHEKRKQRRAKTWKLYWGAVAASFLLLIMLWLPQKQEPVFVADLSQTKEKKQEITLILDNGEEVFINKDFSYQLKMEKVNIMQEAKGGLTYVTVDTLSKDSCENVGHNILIVPRGREYFLTLADGTKIWLNSETTLKFPTHFTGKTRNVELVGEGYFEVAKDKSCPFIVHSKNLQVTVLGTSFNVMAYHEEQFAVVTLKSGKVQVNSCAGQEILLPNWQAVWDVKNETLSKQEVDVDPLIAWKEGMFDFVNMPLERLVCLLGRWYDVDFVFKDETIRKICFTGAIKRTQSLEFMLDFIEITSNVKYHVKDKTIYLDLK